MKKIIVSSQNPVKINATLRGFEKMFPEEQFEIEGVSVLSGVRDQPMNDDETFSGASNRVDNAIKNFSGADYYVGIEGGVEEKDSHMAVFAYIVIKDSAGSTGKARTGTFFLPESVALLVREGKELGEANDVIFDTTNSKQKNGAIGILTNDIIDRTGYYIEALILALIPFKNRELYCL